MALLGLCALALPFAVGSVTVSAPGRRHGAPPSSVTVGSLVQRLQRGALGGNASRHLEAITGLGQQLTLDSWLSTGPEALQALKTKFFSKAEVKVKLHAACPWDGDCPFSQGATLFCGALRSAASDGKLGDMALLESMVDATLMSTRFYGVDTVTQGALIMKFDREEQWASRILPAASSASSAALEGLRQRAVEKPDFQELVSGICDEMQAVRPQCPSRASEGLLCQALGQAAAVSVGAQGACSRLVEVVLAA